VQRRMFFIAALGCSSSLLGALASCPHSLGGRDTRVPKGVSSFLFLQLQMLRRQFAPKFKAGLGADVCQINKTQAGNNGTTLRK